MNFGDLAIGWREALLAVVALLAVYVFYVFRRLRRLKRPPLAPAPPTQSTAEPSAELPHAPPSEASAESGSRATAASRPIAAYAEASFPWNEPPDPPAANAPTAPAVDDARLRAVENELAQLRDEAAMLRAELAALREEIKQQVDRVQAAQHVAPIYGDAMQMAVAGYDAATIAERCGVARAEAELVVALVRNRDDSEPTMRER